VVSERSGDIVGSQTTWPWLASYMTGWLGDLEEWFGPFLTLPPPLPGEPSEECRNKVYVCVPCVTMKMSYGPLRLQERIGDRGVSRAVYGGPW
jgi:hypothetical protein